MMKNKLRYLYYQSSFDHLVLLLLPISLVIGLVSAGRVQIISRVVFVILAIVGLIRLFIHLAVEWYRDRDRGTSKCHRREETMSIMMELANRMKVKLHPTNPLEIVPGLRNAKARCGGRVQICCTLLCGLEGTSLEGVLAYEIAHLKKRHKAKMQLSWLAFVPMLVYMLVSWPVAIPFLVSLGVLSLAVFGLMVSLISWQHEYEADAVASEYVGERHMANALEQVAQLLHKHRDTFSHPSIKRRISRLLSNEE